MPQMGSASLKMAPIEHLYLNQSWTTNNVATSQQATTPKKKTEIKQLLLQYNPLYWFLKILEVFLPNATSFHAWAFQQSKLC